MRAIGKRDQERLVPLQNRGRSRPSALARLPGRPAGPDHDRAAAAPAAQAWRDGTAQIIPHSMTAVTVNQRVERRGREAVVARLTPHDGRRTYVSDVLDLCGDLSIAQQLAGHASPTTTSRYGRRTATAPAGVPPAGCTCPMRRLLPLRRE